MKRIYLIGYMGSGKTTLGKAFACAAGMQFIDLDWYIEERMHRTIRELFAERGESGFREVERNMLYEVGEFENVVIAAGGGTPCFFDNIAYMNRTGDTVFLNASPEALFRRLKVAKAKRPLLADKTDEELMGFIKDGLAGRMAFYSQAKYHFDSSLLEDRRQIGESVERLRTMLEEKS
ncbi:shikimate kinase [Bacteroides gallinaceum]|uniref:Shikimate kinase n=2 Tax=Bacteroidaceae TaxID=815 RepID=A0ABT7X5H9_9BACE|nr:MULTISPECIES: shikimate kinase [Bacteroidaceae]MBD8039260.1 shikimate kinase [Phocaeicola intestinalis]MBM6659157.1 shikimate kinase [Bacteroides gallinaceum]MBM6946394.1 shikimate kinase [Bacteroides gallinaceum]MDN0049341.1 shikimate kinase [Bacteroides gallinaceum]MDN0066933.1 shikimate kinase [Bacteroides gallinaceum]